MDISIIENNVKGLAIRENIAELEIACLEEEQVECNVYHHFNTGIYMREVHIPKGTFAIGHHQKTEHLNVFVKGKVNFVEDDGTVTVLTAPMIFTSKPGRKIGLALEDMVWLNVYPTEETDIETLESTYLDKSDYFLSVQDKTKREDDIADFNFLVKEGGLSEHHTSILTGDHFISNISTIGVFDSNINGKGVFTMAYINNGDVICPISKYINHSKNPNSTIINSMIVASRNIDGCLGGKMGEEITIDYRELMRSELCQQ